MTSLREQIQGVQDLKREEVQIPEWGLTLYVHTITALERERCGQMYEDSDDEEARKTKACLFMCRVLVKAVRDADGKLVFQDEDESWLCKKASSAIARLFGAVARLNAMTREEQEAIRKNSEPTTSAASATG